MGGSESKSERSSDIQAIAVLVCIFHRLQNSKHIIGSSVSVKHKLDPARFVDRAALRPIICDNHLGFLVTSVNPCCHWVEVRRHSILAVTPFFFEHFFMINIVLHNLEGIRICIEDTFVIKRYIPPIYRHILSSDLLIKG